MAGIIYLVQPFEFSGSKIFKIGMSESNTIKRIKSYGSKCNVIRVFECVNPKEVEKALITKFKNEFELFKGREYFNGDKSKMIECFEKIMKSFILPEYEVSRGYIHIDELWHNFDICDECEFGCDECEECLGCCEFGCDECKCDKVNCLNGFLNSREFKKIQDIFPNYLEDEAFGGPKKLIKINLDRFPDR